MPICIRHPSLGSRLWGGKIARSTDPSQNSRKRLTSAHAPFVFLVAPAQTLVAPDVLAQARERLLSKVKADQERLKHLDARLMETAEVVESMKHRLEDLESDMKPDRKGDVSQNKV